jgi:GNAT superfamily N-acetyltransferase
VAWENAGFPTGVVVSKAFGGAQEGSRYHARPGMAGSEENAIRMQPSVQQQPNVRIRRLWPSDVADYRAHLLRLDAKARYSRFASIVSDELIIRHAEKCFGLDCVLYGLFVDGILRGATELHMFEPGSPYTGAAEAAFSIERNWRHQGIGSILMKRLLRAARNRGLSEIVIICLPQNFAMLKLARNFDVKLKSRNGEVAGKFAVRMPTALSIFDEMLDDSVGLATAILDLQRRILLPSRDVA